MLRIVSAVLAGTFCASIAMAQSGNNGRSSSRLPTVGTALPNVTVFDSEGNKFSTGTLREQYSVLVFGCLT